MLVKLWVGSCWDYRRGSRRTTTTSPRTTKKEKREDHPPPPPYGLALLWIGTVSIAYGYEHEFSPLNWSFLFYVPVMMFLLLTLEVEASQEQQHQRQQQAEKQDHAKIIDPFVVMPSKRPVWMTLAVCIAFFYSFGTIILGTMEEASCNMFSNLKIHGGGNHLILPTGLLFRWYRDDISNPYGGGEVRIVSTTSNWLQEIYPNDMSHILSPSPLAADLLTKTTAMPTPIFLNPGANRVLGLRERGWITVPPHGKFIQYSVPSLEWKRLLTEAIERDVNFDVTYAHLPESRGDEMWRGTASERKVDLKVRNGGQIVKCKVQFQNGTKTNCQQSTEIPYNLDTPWLIRKISLYHGYPILYEHDGKTPRKSIQCFGP
mmetsp:Transcript_13659/g.33033  ORF Transcript_13659/g.33033 Transcript_13659/m.33033 type:complete len:374 (-) Transcript_13659:71-1192(-)